MPRSQEKGIDRGIMTDQELFDKVKREGECWHEFNHDSLEGTFMMCFKCLKYQNSLPCEEQDNPDFSTWEGFGWLWERLQEYKKWKKFVHRYGQYDPFSMHEVLDINTHIIHPTRFRDALKEFFKDN